MKKIAHLLAFMLLTTACLDESNHGTAGVGTLDVGQR